MLVGTPETRHDDIVRPAAFAIHAYFYALLDDGRFPISGRILTSLIGIEDFGAASAFNAMSKASRHNLTSICRPILHPNTKRLSQSITTQR